MVMQTWSCVEWRLHCVSCLDYRQSGGSIHSQTHWIVWVSLQQKLAEGLQNYSVGPDAPDRMKRRSPMATLLTTTERAELPPVTARRSKDVLQVLNRLESLLPLPRKHRELSPALRSVHRLILQRMLDTGKPPTQATLAAILGSPTRRISKR